MNNKIKKQFLWTIFLVCTFFVAPLHADETRDRIFNGVNDALRSADVENAKILAPKSYAKALDDYNQAVKRYDRGQNIERIKKDIADAARNFSQAIDTSKLAQVTLAKTITALSDAKKAGAEKHAQDIWSKGMQAFADAASKLESGSLKNAQREASESETLFRQAELQAIKASYLNETRTIITQAEENKAEKYAPQTLTKAKSLLSQAGKALSENRYDTDQPRDLARQAKYEANHANHIAQVVEPVLKKKVSVESLILEMEEPVIKIASSLDLLAALDGTEPDITSAIRNKIALLQKDSYELVERRQEILKLESEIQALELRLGLQSQRLEIQEKKRRQFAEIERMFLASEAVVLKQGENILIRMVGLNFKSGKSAIEADNYALLKKIQRALNVFPSSQVLIEGHTDSYGGDDANLDLSHDRALAVRSYLLANLPDRDISSIRASGFGETQPIANNESAEGRAKNRRIDLKIEFEI